MVAEEKREEVEVTTAVVREKVRGHSEGARGREEESHRNGVRRPPEHETRDGKEELTRNVQGRGKCRLSTPLALVDVSRRRKNEELRKVGVEQGISVEEMIAARLYTGPCAPHPHLPSHPPPPQPLRRLCRSAAARPGPVAPQPSPSTTRC